MEIQANFHLTQEQITALKKIEKDGFFDIAEDPVLTNALEEIIDEVLLVMKFQEESKPTPRPALRLVR